MHYDHLFDYIIIIKQNYENIGYEHDFILN